MGVRVTVTDNTTGQVLASGEFEVTQPGDIERAVTEVLTHARSNPAYKVFNLTVQVSKA